MNIRIEKLRHKFKALGIDMLFVSDQSNVTYLTGFTGLSPNEREGFLVITQKKACLLTFSTYFGLYKNGGDGFSSRCITSQKRLSSHLMDFAQQEKILTAGFEKNNITVSELENLTKKVTVGWIGIDNLVENLRINKDQAEIVNIKKAAAITDNAFSYIVNLIKKGVSEKYLSLLIEFYIKKKADDIAFSPIVAFNENAAIPHYLPSKSIKLTNNSLILIDIGARVNGYCSDMTRVVFYGKPSTKNRRLYQTVYNIQKTVLNKLKSGIKAASLDSFAKKKLKHEGYPEYLHGLGHGVGLAIHESPRLKIGSTDILKENMIVTVEPAVYLAGHGGVRLEDLVLLKKDAIEVLSKSTKEIIII